MATMTFYPDAHPETSSVDGHGARRDALGTTWADIRGLWTNVFDSVNNGYAFYLSSYSTSGWVYLYKSGYVFNITGLPSGVTISSAVIRLRGKSSSVDGLSITPSINIYSMATGSNTSLSGATFGSDPYCDTAITYAGWSAGGFNVFTLNATGLSALNTAYSGSKIFKTGTRNPEYDVANIEPAWTASAASFLQVYFSEQGVGYKPELVITYTAPTTTRLASVIFGNVVAATRAVTTTRLASVIFGSLVWGHKGFDRLSSVVFGITALTIAPIRSKVRFAVVVIGNMVSVAKGVAVSRLSSVRHGINILATRRVSAVRLSGVISGIKTTSSRSQNFIRNATVILSVITSSLKSVAAMRHASVVFGQLVTIAVKGRIMKIITTVSGYRSVKAITSAYRKIKNYTS